MYYQYKCKSYLNASHYIVLNNKNGTPHSHCFEISVDIMYHGDDNFISFTKIEKIVDDIIAPYQEKLINNVYPFDHINPTLENISNYFKDVLSKEFKKINCELIVLEIAETPSRVYVLNVVDLVLQEKCGMEIRLPYQEGDLEWIPLN